MSLPKPRKIQFERYTEGISQFKKIDNPIKLSANESALGPSPKAIEAYEKLTKHFDVYILSTAPWNNPSAWTDKLLWVQEHLGDLAHKRLILSHNKNLNAGDFLIDDRTANGAGEFKGEHIHFLSEKFKNWNDVLNYLIPNEQQ